MRNIVSLLAVALFAVSSFAVPANTIIETTKVLRKGDSLTIFVPIDFGQYITGSEHELTPGAKCLAWVVFDKNNDFIAKPGEDRSINVVTTETADGNWQKFSFSVKGYKGNILWSVNQGKIPFHVNIGFNNAIDPLTGKPVEPDIYAYKNKLGELFYTTKV